MISGVVGDVAGNTAFQMAFVIGASFAVMTGVVSWTLRAGTLPVGGLVIAFGFVVGVVARSELEPSVFWGLVMLSGGGLVAGHIGRQGPVHPIVLGAFALPGAVALSTTTESPAARWLPSLMVCVIGIASPLVADFDTRRRASGWSLVCFAISAGGVYLTVPDTELAIILLGVCLPTLFLSWPTAFASLGWAGAYAAVGTLVWVGGFEARGRPAALLGVVGCLGLLVAEPIAAQLRGDRFATTGTHRPPRRSSILPIVAAQCVLALVASRIAGRTHSVRAAILLTAAELAAAVSVLWYLDRRTQTRTGPDSEAA
jgi:hypothetical protein